MCVNVEYSIIFLQKTLWGESEMYVETDQEKNNTMVLRSAFLTDFFKVKAEFQDSSFRA